MVLTCNCKVHLSCIYIESTDAVINYRHLKIEEQIPYSIFFTIRDFPCNFYVTASFLEKFKKSNINEKLCEKI